MTPAFVTRSFQSEGALPREQGSTAFWEEALSPISLKIQQNELARAQRLCMGGMATPCGQVVKHHPPKQGVLPNDAFSSADKGPIQGSHLQDTSSRKSGPHAVEGSSAIKNPLFEGNMSGENSADSPKNPRPHTSVSFRSAIRRAADKSRRNALQTSDAASVKGEADHLHHESVRLEDQAEAKLLEQYHQQQSSLREFAEEGPHYLQDEFGRSQMEQKSSAGKTPFQLSETMAASHVNSSICVASPSNLLSTNRDLEHPPEIAWQCPLSGCGQPMSGGGSNLLSQDVATPDTMVSIMNPTWRPNECDKDPAHSMTENTEDDDEAIRTLSERPVKCSLLESMNSVSEELG